MNIDRIRIRVIQISIFLLASFNGFPQAQVSGVVLNEKDNSPLPFVSIGIINTAVSTITELDGSFQIKIPKKLSDRELLFSALGFERKTVPLNTDSMKITVLLKEKITELNEITVKSKSKFKRFEFGNREFDGGSMYAHTESAGSAMAILVDNVYPNYSTFNFPAYLDKVQLRIVNNTFREFKLRLRLYAVDSVTGKPGKDLLDKDIVVYEKIRNGWLDLELSEYNIMVNGPFYVGFEWILDSKDRAFLHKQYAEWHHKHPELVTQESAQVGSGAIQYSNYNGTLWAGTSFGTSALSEKSSRFKCYYRYNSFGEWFVSPAALCMRILVFI